MKMIMMAAVSLLVANAVAAQDVVHVIVEEGRAAVREQIRSLCADEWPQDFVMQEYCIGEQQRGYDEVQAFEVLGSTERTIIWANCSTEWTDTEGRTDWVMMDYCVDEQVAALERIQAQ